jgi:anti-anti-sigma factor
MWSPSLSVALPLLAVSAVPDREHVRVIAAGEVDVSTVGELRDQLRELLDVGWREVLVDLREVTFMDSSGVHALLEAHVRARAEDRWLAVVVDDGPVRDLLHLTGIHRTLSLVCGGPIVVP